MAKTKGKAQAKKLTGWDAVFSIKEYQTNVETGEDPLIPKSVLVRHGVWEDVVEDTMLSGHSDRDIRVMFAEYGCKPAEIDRYFEQYA